MVLFSWTLTRKVLRGFGDGKEQRGDGGGCRLRKKLKSIIKFKDQKLVLELLSD